MTVQAKRLETVTLTTHAQLEWIGQLLRVQPRLERVAVTVSLFPRLINRPRTLAGEMPASRQIHPAGNGKFHLRSIRGHLGPLIHWKIRILGSDIDTARFAHQPQTTDQVDLFRGRVAEKPGRALEGCVGGFKP